jgi:hypothetical protein
MKPGLALSTGNTTSARQSHLAAIFISGLFLQRVKALITLSVSRWSRNVYRYYSGILLKIALEKQRKYLKNNFISSYYYV